MKIRRNESIVSFIILDVFLAGCIQSYIFATIISLVIVGIIFIFDYTLLCYRQNEEEANRAKPYPR